MLTNPSLAWAELRLALCNFLFHFDVKLRPECDNWIQQKLYLVWEKDRLMVELTRRE